MLKFIGSAVVIALLLLAPPSETTPKKADISQSYYNSADEGYVTEVKNQEGDGTCWAFATTAVMETSAIKHGLGAMDLSEEQLVRFFYNRTDDPLKNTTGDRNDNISGQSDHELGGASYFTCNNIITWACGGQEMDMPYREEIEDREAYAHGVIVTDIHRLQDRKTGTTLKQEKKNVKRYIKRYGSVTCNYNISEKYAMGNNVAFYCPKEDEYTHEAQIVGWDDDYPKENFKKTPENNGAWIVKNSWGKGTGDKGYSYISYEDKSICNFIAIEVERADKYKYNYQYDGSAGASYIELTEDHKVANVYEVKMGEWLSAVSFLPYTKNAEYEIEVWISNRPQPETGECVYKTKGTRGAEGYRTIDIDPVKLEEKFFCIVIKPKNTIKMAIGDSYTHSNSISFVEETSRGQSYVYNGEWEDLHEKGQVARIKGFVN